MNGTISATGCYADSKYRTYLEGLEFDPEVADAVQEHEVRYRANYNIASSLTIYAKLSLMCAANVYWTGCQADNQETSTHYYADEGEPYTYFKNNDTKAARIHYSDTNSPSMAWLLTAYNTSNFIYISPDGSATIYDAPFDYIPAARFCLGSSVDSSSKTDELTISYKPSGCITFADGNPVTAKAGETIKISTKVGGTTVGNEGIGWAPTSKTVSEFEDLTESSEEYSNYSFTMPNEDVTIYTFCLGGQHAYTGGGSSAGTVE